ncbi:hypothetical protein [Kibdelosporangium aridum]|uniref:Uncharacterized protein n=1 Tax=Kibdelosporangium aridum TaxID=2030 RepID=A0A1W2FZ94_KIBAR|nr:hypothetical protein [Kibdelosporangium aridum]SMD27042.1 hypothetical protein SAMN05661093_10639 [Kibdelosporangium aridum]
MPDVAELQKRLFRPVPLESDPCTSRGVSVLVDEPAEDPVWSWSCAFSSVSPRSSTDAADNNFQVTLYSKDTTT